MTDDQINAAIAEACGWKPKRQSKLTKAGHFKVSYENPPDYCTNLNAMHEAEKVLAPKNSNNFAEKWWNYCKLVRVNGANEAIHATARQRAEAFLRTLGKWEEVQG